MGSDNLHTKRKQRTIDSLKRKISYRKPYDVILIVCEGKKTEPYYLNGLKDDLKLHNANIKVLGCPIGNDPVSIAAYAIDKLQKNNDYDRVYCVFDKEHTNYQEAIDKINANFKNNIPIYAIPSVPCFEYWLLLHFEESARPYKQKGNKSVGDQIVSELKRYLPDYKKGHKNIFYKTKSNLNLAIVRAKRIVKQQEKSGTDNPSTKMYELVEYLMSLAK